MKINVATKKTKARETTNNKKREKLFSKLEILARASPFFYFLAGHGDAMR